MKIKILLACLTCIISFRALAQNTDDVSQVREVLEKYKSSIEALDTTGTGNLFVPKSIVIEMGKVEGRYQDYLANHLGPELHHFTSFKFSNYVADIVVDLPYAFATETYNYTIVLEKDASVVERRSAATTILKKVDGEWKIWQTHTSSRRPQ